MRCRRFGTKTYLAGVIVLTILTSRYLLGPAGPVLSDVPFLKEVGAYQQGFVEGAPAEKDLIAISDEARTLFESFGDSIGTDVSSLGKVADAFAGAALSDIALVLVGALLSLYVVTRPFFMPGYRLTRLLLNVADAPDALPSTTARWSVQHATGAYRRERAVFARFGERPPAERPLDLVIPLLWLSLPLALGVYLILNVDDVLFEQPAGYWLLGVPVEFAIAVGCGLLTLAALRVAWLWRTWRRRSRGAGTLYEVVLPGGARATVRNTADVAALVYLVPYYLPVWWAIVNTQLWQVEPADSRRSRWNAFIAFAAFLRLPRAFIIPPAVSLWHTRRRLHEVQRSAAITPRALWTALKRLIPLAGAGYLLILAPIPNISLYLAPIPLRLPIVDDGPDGMLTLVAIGLLTSTSVLAFVAAYVQGRVNEVLVRRGEPVAEGPG